jgi:hypothetical protein
MSCAKPQKPLPKPAEARRWIARWLIAGYRLGLLAAAFFCLFFLSERRSKEAGDRLDSSAVLPLVSRHFPKATSIGEPEGEDRVSAVLNASSEIIGWVAQTRPDSDAITGYAGASNLMVLMDANRRVIGVEILTSADTSGHVAKVREDDAFMNQWNGRHQASLNHADKPAIVSGASLTSEAMARGIAARFGAKGMNEWFPEEVALSEVKRWFPDAASVDGTKVLSPKGEMLGTLLRSSRMGIAARGFQGASDVLLALDAEGKTILGAAMRGSRDNEPYISDARDAVMYDQPYEGKAPESIIAAESGTTVMVSGASRTAESVEETVKEMLRRHLAPVNKAEPKFGMQEGVALIWIAAGLWLGLGSMRGKKRVRTGFAILTVLLGGLWLGLMLGQDQWIKWSMRGSISGSMLPLLALTAAALLIPAAFGKNIYCSQLCAHGAAQQLLGNLRKRRFTLPPKLHRVMVMMPWLTLFVLWALAFAGMSVPFADAEPFEVWSVGFIALLPVLIFAGGLIASVFLPQAYCHYGCPTGAVLKFLASSPGRWTKRDAIAGGMVGIAWLSLLIP